jgi:ABC transporter substrate binding protein (PQQ-dependent alcohol dehydrogenase system)
MIAAIHKALDEGVTFFLVDAPAEVLRLVAPAVKGRDALLFNVSAPEDSLRRDLCAMEVVHTMPSRAQLMDGLTQFLVSRKWRDYLVLRGPRPSDVEMAAAFERSAKKFGARIIATRDFTPGTDPREREKNNVGLLSAINRDWDVTFVADIDFDFSRDVPYRTIRPRPVVGSIDLEPLAWHWTWAHNGAPQLNTRFMRLSGGRHMGSADWSAWMAVKIIAQSALRTKSTDFKTRRSFILKEGYFDGDKGEPMSIRPWDHQLRQAVLLASPFSVIAAAPMEGFLHQRDVLDTLGDDEPETTCRLNK